MSQVDLDEAIDSVKRKWWNNRSALESLSEWLKESDESEYREREQTAQAWIEITDTTLNWLWELKQDQKTVSERKFKNKKREVLREVYESGEYPYAKLPEPEPLIE